MNSEKGWKPTKLLDIHKLLLHYLSNLCLFYDICSTKLPTMKEEFVWLKEVHSIVNQSSVRNLVEAYTCFFKKKNSALRFKSKKKRRNK
ncbi:Transposase (plasmid) [Bacillus thuringiensis serovar indiana]|nr:Transposase [Bacillus thuringiensis serovar indiana]